MKFVEEETGESFGSMLSAFLASQQVLGCAVHAILPGCPITFDAGPCLRPDGLTCMRHRVVVGYCMAKPCMRTALAYF